MTHAIYTYQRLQQKSIARLKQIYCEIGCTVEVIDKRCKDGWISAFALGVGAAIADYQASKVQKLTPAAPDNQASEKLTTVEISFYDHEYYAGDKLIAAITYDNDLTRPWVVGAAEQKRIACQSALEAVWRLAVAQTPRHTELLNRRFEMLTPMNSSIYGSINEFLN
jgi:hypothetical protein